MSLSDCPARYDGPHSWLGALVREEAGRHLDLDGVPEHDRHEKLPAVENAIWWWMAAALLG